MRKIVLPLLAALLVVSPAFAQQGVTPIPPSPFPMTGTNVATSPTSTPLTAKLTTTNDLACALVSGSTWGTVVITTAGTFSQVLTPLVATDPALVNLVAAPYVRRIDASSANPATSATITANAGTYELPIPSNTKQVCVKTTVTSGTATISISGGQMMAPGVSVVATLYDVTGASTNTAVDTLTLETAGWSALAVDYIVVAGAASNFSIGSVDAGGTAISVFRGMVSPNNAGTGISGAAVALTYTWGAAAQASVSLGTMVPSRARFVAEAAVALQARVRVSVRRGQ